MKTKIIIALGLLLPIFISCDKESGTVQESGSKEVELSINASIADFPKADIQGVVFLVSDGNNNVVYREYVESASTKVKIFSNKNYNLYALVNVGNADVTTKEKADYYAKNIAKLSDFDAVGIPAAGVNYIYASDPLSKSISISCITTYPRYIGFDATLPGTFKNVLTYATGKVEWTSADDIMVSDGKSKIIYSSTRGGSNETTFIYRKPFTGTELSESGNYSAVFPSNFGMLDAFPSTQYYVNDEHAYNIPMYAETNSTDKKFDFTYVAGLLMVNIQSTVLASGYKFTADEPLSGKATYSVSGGVAKVTLEGTEGVTFNQNPIGPNQTVLVAVMMPGGTYHNVKLTSAGGEVFNLGTITINNGERTAYGTTIKFTK